LSRQTLDYTAGIIRRHRKQIGSPWRKLNPGRQALLVLAYLRQGETFAELAAGFGVGTATAWRYVTETVALLAARSPRLRKALRDARKAGHAYLVIDGTLIPIDRVAADRPFYSGKHRKHGMNLQVIASPDGGIVWVSGYIGEDCLRTPHRGRDKPAAQKDANRAHAKLRAPRRACQRPAQVLAHPAQAALLPLARRQLAKAIHVLQTRETGE
jgi:hypothetical protein